MNFLLLSRMNLPRFGFQPSGHQRKKNSKWSTSRVKMMEIKDGHLSPAEGCLHGFGFELSGSGFTTEHRVGGIRLISEKKNSIHGLYLSAGSNTVKLFECANLR